MSGNILRLPRVLSKIGMSKSWLYDQIGAGNFPEQVPLGARGVGWVESEVDAWIEERSQKRHQGKDQKVEK